MSFNQGTNLLGLRKVQKFEVLGKRQTLEGFNNASGEVQSYSSCGAEAGNPRYGWCPPTPNSLMYEKDDDPNARQAQVDKLYGLMSQYGTLYKNYIENVQNYVHNPPGWIYGQNVYVPPCWGDDDCGAAPCPSCPKGWDHNSVKNQCTNCDPATIAQNLGPQYQFDPTICPTRNSQAQCTEAGGTWSGSGTPTPAPAPPQPTCWFQITGQCSGYPDMSNKAWFRDDQYGGPPFSTNASQTNCDARKQSWEQSCGPNAVISGWYGTGNPPTDADKPDYSACGCAEVVPPNGAVTGQSSLLDRGFPAANLTPGNKYCWTADWGGVGNAKGIAACEKSNGCMLAGDPSNGYQGGCITKGPPR